jgi:hypothetical protein
VWKEKLDELTLLPRARQFAALQELRATYEPADYEQWNTAFGTESLYDAWTQLPFMQQLYESNRAVIGQTLQGRSGWHVVEIGGGNGALWEGVFDAQQAGTLTLVEPHPEAHASVAKRLPSHVRFQSIVDTAERAAIPDADVIVSSLTLHHVAGVDIAQRRAFGLDGDGKSEILRRCLAAIRRRHGVGILNEADCYNEIDLAPSDPVLVDRFLDAYVRRCARAIAEALDDSDSDSAQQQAWTLILKHWCLDQTELAFVPREQRDVYELDAAHWLGLFAGIGAESVTHRYTDAWHLFQQYVYE